MTDNQALTELEQRLAAPGGEALRQQVLQRADALQQRLAQQLARSVPRADYPQVQACADAARAARETLAEWPAHP